jgi:hypothetical protein
MKLFADIRRGAMPTPFQQFCIKAQSPLRSVCSVCLAVVMLALVLSLGCSFIKATSAAFADTSWVSLWQPFWTTTIGFGAIWALFVMLGLGVHAALRARGKDAIN